MAMTVLMADLNVYDIACQQVQLPSGASMPMSC